MTKKTFAWLVMTLLALAVASYAIAMVFAAEFRPPLVRALFAERPVATFAHFMGGAIAIAAGAFQLNSRLRTRFIEWLVRSRHSSAMLPNGLFRPNRFAGSA